jgi:hypothetical protein
MIVVQEIDFYRTVFGTGTSGFQFIGCIRSFQVGREPGNTTTEWGIKTGYGSS